MAETRPAHSRRASTAIHFSLPATIGLGLALTVLAVVASWWAQDKMDRFFFLWPVHMVVLATLSVAWGTDILPRGRAVWGLVFAQFVLILTTIVAIHGWADGWSLHWALSTVALALALGVVLRLAMQKLWYPPTPVALSFALSAALAAAVVLVLIGGVPTFRSTGDEFQPHLAFILLVFVQNSVGLLVLGLLHYPSGRESLPNAPHLPWQIAGIVLLVVGATVLPHYAPDLPPEWMLLVPALWAGLVLRYRQALILMALVVAFIILSNYVIAPPTGNDDELAYRAFIQTVIVSAGTLLLVILRQRREETLIVLRQERSAARAEAMVQSTVLESMSEGLVLVDQDGMVLFHNAAAVRLLGKKFSLDRPTSWVGFFGLLTPDGGGSLADSEEYRASVADGQASTETLMAGRPDEVTGEMCILLLSIRPVTRADPPRRLLLIRDVTEQQQRQEQLLGFAQTVAHDLKSPMAGIDMWMNRLGAALADDDLTASRESLAWLHRGSARLRKVIDDWLAFTVTRHSELQPVSLSLLQLVEQTLDGATEVSPDHIPIIELDLEHRVQADEHLIRQLLANLVQNAIKYTPEDRPPHLRISSHAGDEGWVIVEVADRGRGIPVTEQESVFREYMRSNRDAAVADGHGIGLALCREAVERHGGWIRATGNPYGGATLVFTLPRA